MAISKYPNRRVVQRVQMITATGTWTLPAGYGTSRPLLATVKLVGGGGGGGGGAWSSGTGAAQTNRGAGGGGGGSGVALVYEDLIFTDNLSFVIGAGGTGGTGATALNADPTKGGNGGHTSLNSTWFGPGGSGGGQGRPFQTAAASSTSDSISIFTTNFIFYIDGRFDGSQQNFGVSGGGAGGSGGSGGAGNNQNITVSDTTARGGTFGSPGGNGVLNARGMNLMWATNGGYSVQARGFGGPAAMTVFTQLSAREDFNQAGGGGGGGWNNSDSTTTGAIAAGGQGGGRVGGLSGGGADLNTNNRGQINGGNALTLAAGGGGGGARYRTELGSNGGNGGSGGAGYAEITWIEESL